MMASDESRSRTRRAKVGCGGPRPRRKALDLRRHALAPRVERLRGAPDAR